jgi:hypothetical protein
MTAYQLDNTVQLRYVDCGDSDLMDNTSYLVSAAPQSATGSPGKVIEDRAADCRPHPQGKEALVDDDAAAADGVVQVGWCSRRATGVGEDVKAPVPGTAVMDDAA